MPNFNEISQSTAEIKLLPVSETDGSVLEFYYRFRFRHYVVIGMSFYTCVLNFVVIGRSAAEL